MIEITKTIEWDMGHRIPNHRNKCSNPHGHRYRLEVTLEGLVNEVDGHHEEGMVCDFSTIKELMLEKIHDPLDHGFMVYRHDSLLLNMFQSNSNHNFKIITVDFIPTAENIARWCFDQLNPVIAENTNIVNCRLYETPNSFVDYKNLDLDEIPKRFQYRIGTVKNK